VETTSTTLAPIGDVIAEYENEQKSAGKPAETEVSKEMFLQLLVAQIRNQNPLSPADGLAFVSQLAEFSGLEQMIAIRDEVTALRAAIEAVPAEDGAAEAPPMDGGPQTT